jgi:hypothetical protein
MLIMDRTVENISATVVHRASRKRMEKGQASEIAKTFTSICVAQCFNSHDGHGQYLEE